MSTDSLQPTPLELFTWPTSSYRLAQRIRYEYTTPVANLRQRLVVVPPAIHGGQRRLSWDLRIAGVAQASSRTRRDSFGNTVLEVAAAAVDEAIEFLVTSEVQRESQPTRHRVRTDDRMRVETRLTEADRRISSMAAGSGPIRIGELCRRVHDSFAYEWGVTGVRTTAAEALAGGRGVCQDYAHVMIAACRSAGVPARYVSGHLLGEGGSHAWVEVLLSDARRPDRWVVEAWDPTHDRRAHDGYVTIAVGRDYLDVAPVSGTYEGPSDAGSLEIAKHATAA